jgi:lipopolysaccharide transport system ATP-binding protein
MHRRNSGNPEFRRSAFLGMPTALPAATSMSVKPSAQQGEVVIRVDGVGKMFPMYDTPADRLKQFLLPRLQRLAGSAPGSYHREFWALRSVSLSVHRGETVGIIGRNGAGKSTLLQIICGTHSPTYGTVETSGRIAALLELGAGFNPEFSGRENVYLNGAILGLGNAEVDGRIDEIAEFADIGEFLDQPVKTYSSGMFVRLAFAVQACLEPDILIVDEALSVGDVGFQYKCFKRMEALRRKGVTILMVTHATGQVLEHADRCIVLDGGEIVQDTTDVLAAVLAYEKGMLAEQAPPVAPPVPGARDRLWDQASLQAIQAAERNTALGEKRFGSGRAIIAGVSVLRADGTAMDDPAILRPGEDITFRVRVLAAEAIANIALGLSISKAQGGDVWGDNNLNAGCQIDLSPGERYVDYSVRLPLSSGEYLIHCGLACFSAEEREELDQRRPMAMLRVWSPRAQVGVVFAPVSVSLPDGPT